VGRTSVSGDVANVSELAAEAAELAAEEQEVSRPMDRPVEQSVRARARARARVRICWRPRSRSEQTCREREFRVLMSQETRQTGRA